MVNSCQPAQLPADDATPQVDWQEHSLLRLVRLEKSRVER